MVVEPLYWGGWFVIVLFYFWGDLSLSVLWDSKGRQMVGFGSVLNTMTLFLTGVIVKFSISNTLGRVWDVFGWLPGIPCLVAFWWPTFQAIWREKLAIDLTYNLTLKGVSTLEAQPSSLPISKSNSQVKAA